MRSTRISRVGVVVGVLLLCSPALAQQEEFIRTDADGNGVLNNLVDSLFILAFQFSNGPAPPCLEAADANGDGVFNGLMDAIFLLACAFTDPCIPPDPWPQCGPDPDPANSLGCGVNACP